MPIALRHRQRGAHIDLLAKHKAGNAQIGKAPAHGNANAQISNACFFCDAIEQPSHAISRDRHIAAGNEPDINACPTQRDIRINPSF